jgi:hypothetical protein
MPSVVNQCYFLEIRVIKHKNLHIYRRAYVPHIIIIDRIKGKGAEGNVREAAGVMEVEGVETSPILDDPTSNIGEALRHLDRNL